MMKKTALTIFLLILNGVYAPHAMAEISPEHQSEIKYLKSYVTKSACVFVRNDIKYKGSEAITHIIRKEAHFKDEIMSTEDFIRLAATKSEISGKSYTVMCTENNVENLSEWLQKELLIYRNKAAEGSFE